MNDIRIEIHPSSGIEEVYELSQVLDKGSNSLKYYFRYERPGGKGRFTPTTGRLIISESKAHKIIKLCQEISIGLLPDFATGLDGNTTLVTISHGMNWIQLKWWDKMPEPWLPVRKLLRMVRATEKAPKRERRS
jgi:hypothetical protein